MDINTLSLIASAFIPLLVDLVVRFTKLEAGNAKRIVAVVLAFVVALIPELGNTVPTTDVWEFLKALSVRFGAILVVSQTVYNNFYKEGNVQKVMVGK